VTDFFVPGITGATRDAEDAYAALRGQLALEFGRPPSHRRIFSLWMRRGTVDCVTEVGRHDPLLGGTVIAIFDMGPHRPFVVCRERARESNEAVHEILETNAYSVQEFDA
jgi:hypothetical protein